MGWGLAGASSAQSPGTIRRRSVFSEGAGCRWESRRLPGPEALPPPKHRRLGRRRPAMRGARTGALAALGPLVLRDPIALRKRRGVFQGQHRVAEGPGSPDGGVPPPSWCPPPPIRERTRLPPGHEAVPKEERSKAPPRAGHGQSRFHRRGSARRPARSVRRAVRSQESGRVGRPGSRTVDCLLG